MNSIVVLWRPRRRTTSFIRAAAATHWNAFGGIVAREIDEWEGRRVACRSVRIGKVAAKIPFNREAIAAFCRSHHVRRLAFFGSVLRDDFTP